MNLERSQDKDQDTKIQNQFAFLYSNNEYVDTEVKNTVSLSITQKKVMCNPNKTFVRLVSWKSQNNEERIF